MVSGIRNKRNRHQDNILNCGVILLNVTKTQVLPEDTGVTMGIISLFISCLATLHHTQKYAHVDKENKCLMSPDVEGFAYNFIKRQRLEKIPKI